MSNNAESKLPDQRNRSRVASLAAIVALIGIPLLAVVGFPQHSVFLFPNSQPLDSSDCLGYEKLSAWTQAAECYKRRFVANPDDFGAVSDVARVYSFAGQFGNMAEYAHKMIAVAHTPDESAQAILALGVAYYRLGYYSSAVQSLAEGMDPKYSQTGSYLMISDWLSLSYEANGDRAKACKQYKATILLAKQNDLGELVGDLSSGVRRSCPPN